MSIHLGSRNIFQRGGSSGITLPSILLADCEVVDAYLESDNRISLIPRKRRISNEDGLLMASAVWVLFFVAFAQFAAVISIL